ncbi:WW domain-containing protein wwm1 [Ascosphaera pollenicola]|nr:WW domain-containing protein wwm1 [Ascosphaera pollenicola]
MKLNAKALRYLTTEDFRVLAATEMGSKNHEVVPTTLISQLSGLRGGSAVHKAIATLAKMNLIARVKNAKYDGYRLAYGGLDYLALNAHQKNNSIYSVGNQIGVGKESDIIVVADSTGTQRILKIHRLGRISFRTVKSNRDYLRHRSSASWMYMSRLAAMKEFAFMKALKEHGFPVPEPIAQNRHTIVMSLIDAFPLRQISSVPDPAGLYSELLEMIIDLVTVGLIHGDFNEFNILIKEEPIETPESAANNDPDAEFPVKLVPILIDFPQMVSVDHPNAEMYFDRDVECIKRYFRRRFGFTSDQPGPFFSDAMKSLKKKNGVRLDVEVEASGFSRKMAKELETYMQEVGVKGDAEVGDDSSEESEDEGIDGLESDDQASHGNESSAEEEAVAEPSKEPPVDDGLSQNSRSIHQTKLGTAHLTPLTPLKSPEPEAEQHRQEEKPKHEKTKGTLGMQKLKITDPKQSASRKWRV